MGDEKIFGRNSRCNLRRKTLFTGIVTYGGGKYTTNCVVRQLTAEGARLSLPTALPLPPQIYLIVPRYAAAHKAKIVWYKGGQAGLSLLNAIDLRNVTDRQFDFLKEIWTFLK